MYSPRVLAQFQNERFAGEMPDADVYVQVDNPACGDILRLALKTEDGRISDARFRARGCVASIASASQLCELLIGRSVAEARALRREEIVAALGGLPEASVHASHLAVDALKAALREFAQPGAFRQGQTGT
jgi:NifU-like protein involved in Fe-S cluster formation